MPNQPKNQSSETLTGRMIIAMPNIGDPRFERTVVYLVSHYEDGAMGLIVNRPAEDLRMDDFLDASEIADDAPITTIRFGGPVEPERGFILHSDEFPSDEEATLVVDDGVSFTTNTEVLRAIAAGKGPRRALFAVGYAGWGPGQLEHELRENGWLHCESDEDILFGDEDDTKWARALAKIGVHPSALSVASGSA